MSIREAVVYPFARKFFAGESLSDAVSRVRGLNAKGMGASVDFLGEDVTNSAEADAAFEEYARAIHSVKREGLGASVSVKLTHIGLDMGREIAENNALKLAAQAEAEGLFLWLDMEGSRHTENILGVYRELIRLHRGMVGVAIQASLLRSWRDIRSLVPEGGIIRLVKGAYDEPPEIALQDMADIRAQFTGMMVYLFDSGSRFAVGTHDKALVETALKIAGARRAPFEFQMLMGMRDRLKRQLVRDGFRVVEYVPYGTEWYGYGMRRLKEKRRNILYMAEGLAGR
ncbi:MAG: proline dehydrogenase family protein [Nitrospirae bacterium]|nr:proline dehydrogenase family protein [Nitrospirota bacterium]